MRIGQVIGNVTLNKQDPAFQGARWLVVNPLARKQIAGACEAKSLPLSSEPSLVVFDNIGAGRGDIIGFVEGGEATQIFDGPTPVDATNVAIFDTFFYNPPSSSGK